MTYNDALTKLGADWKGLSNAEKTELLQALEDHVALESGRIACTVEGQFMYTGSDGIVMGKYDRESGKIFINSSQYLPESKYGNDASKLLETCLHEGRHAYQDQAVKGIIEHNNLDELNQWKENFDNYIKYNENPRAYFEQPIEVDARQFASDRLEQLNEERADLLNNTNNYEESKEEFISQILLTSLPSNNEQEQISAFFESNEEQQEADLVEASNAFENAIINAEHDSFDNHTYAASDNNDMSEGESSEFTNDDDGMHI